MPLLSGRTLFCAMLLSGTAALAAVSDSHQSQLDALLAQADEQRSAAPQRYHELISQLTLAKAEMTGAQRSYLDFLQAYQLAYSGKHLQAEMLLSELITVRHPVLIRFRAAYTLANIQMLRRQFVDAFSSLSQAMALLSDIDDAKWRNQGLLSAANSYAAAGLYTESVDYLEQLDSSILSGRDRCLSMHISLQQRQHLQRPLLTAEMDEAIDVCRQAGEQMMALWVTLQKAALLRQNGEAAEALQLTGQYKADIIATGYQPLLLDLYQLSAQLSADLGQQAGANDALALLFAAAENLPFSTALVNGLKLKASLAATAGDYADAYQWHQRYAEAERAMRDERTAQLVAYQLAKGELLKKNQQLALMKEEFRVIELENQLRQQQANRDSLYIGLLALASLLLIYISVRLLHRHRYYKQNAERDKLTGIHNRHFFDMQLQKQLNHCKQQHKPLGVIVFDLDQFKQINDQYGHLIGDQVLQATADICRHFIRSQDIFGRIGGEEFAIALPDCQPDKVLMLAEICRDALEQLDCSHIASGLQLTASFGVSYSQISGYRASEMMRHADQALYLAKYNGRNRVESYEQLQPDSAQSGVGQTAAPQSRSSSAASIEPAVSAES